MILPNLPSKFSSGETLTAAKLNAMIDWMRDIARILPSLQVNTGPGLVYSRSSAGTTVSLAHGYIQASTGGDASTYVPPFAVSVAEDGSVTVAPGTTVNLYITAEGTFEATDTGTWEERTFPPGSAKEGGGVIMTNPFDGGMGIVDDIRDAPPTAVIIATFISDTTQPGGIRVQQLIRSDITFITPAG